MQSIQSYYVYIFMQIKSISSLETRPIKIRPGPYCMGDSAHARTELPRIWVTRYTLGKVASFVGKIFVVRQRKPQIFCPTKITRYTVVMPV